MAMVQEQGDFARALKQAIKDFSERYESFDNAYSSYIGQYGEDAVKIYEPFKISGTIDPVIVILGRSTPLFYSDSQKKLSGALEQMQIQGGGFYIIGRREPPDEKLVVWSNQAELDVARYQARVRVVPSRLHGAIMTSSRGDVWFADLGSSSGTILAGETTKPEPFIVIYATSRVEIRRIPIKGKYEKG